LQDHKGFMWFGTYEGLNRFDGRNFKIYRPEPGNPNSLSVEMIALPLRRSSWGAVDWHTRGLNQLGPEKDRFIYYPYQLNDPTAWPIIMFLRYMKTGKAYCGLAPWGLKSIDRGKKLLFSLQGFKPIIPTVLAENFITTIYEDRQGVLWIGTEGAYIDWTGKKNLIIRNQHQPDDLSSTGSNYISAIYEIKRATCGLAPGRWLDRWDGEKKTYYPI